MRVLAGDVGGTKTLLALYEADGDALVESASASFPSSSFPTLRALVRTFLEGRGDPPERACLGVPGPVVGNRARITNLPWEVDAERIAAETSIGRVILRNDLEATAHGISTLPPEALFTLHAGEPGATGNGALIAAGTGLGEAGLFWDGSRHVPFATEGGHATFGPRTEIERELHRHLSAELDHVSWERVVSGPGLAAIHAFLCDRHRVPLPDWLAEEPPDPAAAVAQAALERGDAIATEALHLFVDLYGAEAGNLGLKMLATGGVWIGGGIAPKIRPALESGRFVEAFLAKGRMRHLMERMPVRLVLEPRTALRGAARIAAMAP